MRVRYQESLIDGVSWLKQNTPKDAVVLTPRPLEVAYLSGRRTMSMFLVQSSAIDKDLLIDHNVSHILIPWRGMTEEARMTPYIHEFEALKNIGFLKESYRDPHVLIWKVVRKATDIR